MNILFCNPGFREARQELAGLLPGSKIDACEPSDLPVAVTDIRPDVLIACGANVTAEIMSADSVCLVQQFGVGLEGVDIEAATTQGVWVADVPAAKVGNADSVAEHAIMLMLALSRRLPQVNEDIATWGVNTTKVRSLFGKTACIVGLGDIGLEIARRLNAFHMDVIAVRRRPGQGMSDDVAISQVYSLSELGIALGQSDFVILCAPHTPETHHLICREALSQMKPGSYLVNIARGGLVDHEALLEALRSGWLAGAGLDVFWEEPVDMTHPLFACNVIATPHVAGLTDTACAGIALAVAENVRRISRGQRPKYAANRPHRPRRLPRGLVGPSRPHWPN